MAQWEQTFMLVAQTADHHAPVTRLAFSPDGKLLAAAAQDGHVLLWRLPALEPVDRLKVAPKAVWVCAWSPDSRYLAAGARDNTVHIMDVARRHETAKLASHVDDVHGVAWDATGKRIVSASYDGTLKIWTACGELLRTISAHDGRIEDACWLPFCDRIVSAGRDGVVRLWDPASGALKQTLVGHRGFVLRVVVSIDERTAFTASSDGTVRVWNTETAHAEHVLEGFGGIPHNLAVSSGGDLLVVKDDHRQVVLYRLDTLERIAAVDEPADHHHWYGGVVFHPTEPMLATLGEHDRRIRLWRYDETLVLNARSEAQASSYVNARVALLGDSGVGKTSLARALRDEAFLATQSTHATKVSLLHRNVRESDGETLVSEVYLWDLAGQPAYRLLQHLDVIDIEVAILVFDNRSGPDPMSGVREWEILLRQAHNGRGPSPKRLLVAARADRGRSSMRLADVAAAAGVGQLAGHVITSAKENQGIDELRALILRAIDWDDIPVTVSDERFQRLRMFVSQRASQGQVLLSRPALLREYGEFAARLAAPGLEPEDLPALLDRLETLDLLRRLPVGDRILLDPGQLRSYAAMVLFAAADASDGQGTLEEEAVVCGRIPLLEDERVARREDELEILHAVVEECVSAGVVLRIRDDSGLLLRFPSAATRMLPSGTLPPGPPALTLQASATIDGCFAHLVVAVAAAEIAQEVELWCRTARFVRPDRTASWLTIAEERPGQVCIELRHEAGTREEERLLLEHFAFRRLERIAVDGTVSLAEGRRCPSCGFEVSAEAVRRRRDRGLTWILCNVCDERIELRGPSMSSATPTKEVVRQVDRRTDARLAEATSEVRTDLKERADVFDVFLSYNTHDRDGALRLGEHLRARGLRPWIDVEQLRPGLPWLPVIAEHLESISAAAVLVGPSGVGPWQEGEVLLLLQQFIGRGSPVIPVLLQGANPETPLPPLLPSLQWVDFNRSQPDPLEQLSWGITGRRQAHA